MSFYVIIFVHKLTNSCHLKLYFESIKERKIKINHKQTSKHLLVKHRDVRLLNIDN